MPSLLFTKEADRQLRALESDRGLAKRSRAVKAALARMEVSLRHPGLQTHEWKSQPCPHGNKLFEAYAENRASAAYRIFWCYVPSPPPNTILIVAITPHP